MMVCQRSQLPGHPPCGMRCTARSQRQTGFASYPYTRHYSRRLVVRGASDEGVAAPFSTRSVQAKLLVASAASFCLVAPFFQATRAAQAAHVPLSPNTSSVHLKRHTPCFASTSSSSATSAASSKAPAPFRQDVVFRYKLLKLFSLPTVGKLLAVIALAVPVSVLGGLAYRTVTAGDTAACINKAYAAWANLPGVSVTEEESVKAAAVMQGLFVFGLLTFAVVLGIITDDISSTVEEVRIGNHDIAETGHTVVLGWNRQLRPVLRQLAAAIKERDAGGLQQPIVVLADREKPEMDDEIREELEGAGIEVITRRGKPFRLDDLHKVAAGQAKTIIILHPDDVDEVAASSQKAATLASLSTAGGISGQTLVVQGWDDGAEEDNAATVAFSRFQTSTKSMVQILGLERISQVMAQSGLQPGLAGVMADLLQHEDSSKGCEFYLRAYDQLTGVEYSTARRHFPSAIPVGVLKAATGKLYLNPKEKHVLQAGDQLVLVSRNVQHVNDVLPEPYQVGSNIADARMKRTRQEFKKIAVLSFGQETEETEMMIRSLAEFSGRGTEVTVIAQEIEGLPCGHLNSTRINLVKGNPASHRALVEGHVAHADSVIITGLHRTEADLADAQVVASVMQLQQLNEDAEHRVQHVVACITNPQTQDVLQQVSMLSQPGSSFSVHTIAPDDLISGIITQVAADPQLNVIYSELFGGSGGCELYLRAPAHYKLPAHVEGTWGQVFEAARAQGETIVGYQEADGTTVLAPDALRTADLAEGTRLVALAETF